MKWKEFFWAVQPVKVDGWVDFNDAIELSVESAISRQLLVNLHVMFTFC